MYEGGDDRLRVTTDEAIRAGEAPAVAGPSIGSGVPDGDVVNAAPPSSSVPGPDAAPPRPVPLPDGWVRAEFAAMSACGPVRDGNEDRVGWAVLGARESARSPRPDAGVIRMELRGPGIAVIVADGLGGHSHGERASRTALRIVLERLAAPDAVSRAADTLRAGFEEANSALLDGLLDDEPDADWTADARSVTPASRARGGQTTLTALAITRQATSLAHVGDCRLFRLRDDLLEQLTNDHTQAMELVRMRLIRRDQAAHHPGRHLLTRSIGGDIVLRVEARSGEPAAGDAYLLCSDGLWSAVTSSEVRAAFEGDLAEGMARLVALSAERGDDDNASVIGMRLLELGTAVDAAPRVGLRLPWRRGSGE